VQGHRGEASCGGAARIPPAAKYNENRAFHRKTAMLAGYNHSLFQPFMRQIRYLADQWNFNGILASINELKRPYQSKNNGIRAACENRAMWSPINARYAAGERRPQWRKSIPAGACPRHFDRIAWLKAHGSLRELPTI
jgi:hypothetical protein